MDEGDGGWAGGGTDLVDLRQHLHFRPMQHPEGQTDHLQILAARRGRDVPRLRPHVVDDALLQPRDQEMCPLVHHLVFDSCQSVEDDCSGATLDIVDRSLCEGQPDGDGYGELVNGA